MSFFDELKRRNVFKVGIAYGITSWLLIQVTDILLESIGAPSWVMQTLFVVLGVGFVIALFFAWAFELTPEGVKREADVDRSQSITPKTGRKLDFAIIGILVLALGYFVLDKFWLSPSGSASSAQDTTAGTHAQQKTFETIAVLPFVDMSPAGDNEYFSDGLTEELLNILARIKELRVAGRTSSFAFKGKDEDLRSIGKKLNVKSILEGSVRKDDKRNRVRITVQLINVEDGFHLWSDTYDRDLDDIFAIQEDIAREVAQALRITLLGEDEARIAVQAATDLSAYDLYLQGLGQLNEYSFESLTKAVDTFQQAIDLDPDYTPARLKLAKTWLDLSQTGVLSRREALENSRPVLEQILEQDPGNSNAHTLMARVYRYERKPLESEQEFRRALDTNPRNVEALTALGRLLFDSGKVTRGLEYLGEAKRIDPYSVRVLWNVGMTHAFMLEPEKAGQYFTRLGEIEPDNPMRYYGPGITWSVAGNMPQALLMMEKAIELDSNDYELAADMAAYWLDLGAGQQAEIWAKRADEMGADQPVPISARVQLYQFREQYSLAADLSKRALDRKLDDRQQSNAIFRRAWISSLVQQGKLNTALEHYQTTLPQVFEDPMQLELNSRRNISQLVEIAILLQMLQPGSPQASALIDAAEQKLQLIEAKWIPWVGSMRRARIAMARGNQQAALAYLNEAYANNFRLRWRDTMQVSFVFKPLHDKPEFKQLVAKFEADMERQREEAYALLGINQ